MTDTAKETDLAEAGAIFISYRRGPANWAAIGLRDLMRQRFPSAEVFHDGASLEGGAPWPDRLREALARCHALLALIDSQWDTVMKGKRRRLDIEEDWVRTEIATALEAGKLVVPILLDGARLPEDKTELPTCLRPLLDRQAMHLRSSGRDETNDRRDIADLLARHLPETALADPPAPAPAPQVLAGTITVEHAAALIAEIAPDTVSIGNMASSQHHEGRHALSEALWREALPRASEDFGAEDPNTLAARHELARAVLGQGRAAEAEGLFRFILSVEEKVLGPEHPGTLSTRHELARAVLGQGRAAEAEGLFRGLVPVMETAQGPEHPDTLKTRNNLARAVLDQGRAAEAERMLLDLLPLRERVQGPEHSHTLGTRRALARAALEQAAVERAKAALAPLPADGGDLDPLRQGQTALLRAFLADLEGDRAAADRLLDEAEGHLAHLAPEHHARRELATYCGTRGPDGKGGTTLWMREAPPLSHIP